MKINFIEVKNFRKMQSCRIEFDEEKTLLVGANNSGKTSAMTALRKFLISPKSLEIRDISIGNWSAFDLAGDNWENDVETTIELNELLPKLDVWLDVPLTQIHHVVHIIPSADWNGGMIGVRLSFEIEDQNLLKAAYLDERSNAKTIEDEAQGEYKPSVSPRNLVEFLEKRFSKYLSLKAYSLDPDQIINPDNKGRASLQSLADDPLELEQNPFHSLINLREIPAMREFSIGGSTPENEDVKAERLIRSLSDHVRSYYDKHIDNADVMSADDIAAYSALQQAEKAFDQRLKTGFASVFDELSDLGVPGVNNPSIEVNTKFRTLDGLSHSTAVQYTVFKPEVGQETRYLPESFAGLGYQNLIASSICSFQGGSSTIDPYARIRGHSSWNSC